MIEVTHRLGDTQFKFHGDGPKEIIEQLAFWTELPPTCPMCGAAIHFTHRVTKEKHTYYGMQCRGEVVHECDLGQNKDQINLFYKSNSWKVAHESRQPGGSGGHDDDESGGSAPAATTSCEWDGCGASLTPGQVSISRGKFNGSAFCVTHQKEAEAAGSQATHKPATPPPAGSGTKSAPPTPPPATAPPKPPAAPSGPPPTAEELGTAKQWVAFCDSQNILTDGEVARFNSKLDEPGVTKTECLDIYEFCNKKYQEFSAPA